MGMHNLDYIINELISGGLDPATPSAIIHQGTLMGQKSITAPLNRLLNEKKANGISSPSIVVIGKIINHQIEECAPVPTYLALSKLNNLISLSTEKECHSLEI